MWKRGAHSTRASDQRATKSDKVGGTSSAASRAPRPAEAINHTSGGLISERIRATTRTSGSFSCPVLVLAGQSEGLKRKTVRASHATTNLYVRLQKGDQMVVSMVVHRGLTYLASLDWVNVVVTAGRARECVPFLKMLRIATVPMLRSCCWER